MKLVIKDLCKSYDDYEVLKDVNIELEKGKIYGILGKNGSGKTTLFNILGGVIEYNSGEFYLEDNSNKIELTDSNISYMLSEVSLPDFLTGYEFIKFYIDMNCPEKIDKIYDYFKMVDFKPEYINKLIKSYSLGMKNKVQMLVHLISDSELFLLDEPLTSFDVVAAKEIKDIIKELKNDRIIIFSTHILELAKSMCDEIIILNNKTLTRLSDEIVKDNNFENKIVEILSDDNENK